MKAAIYACFSTDKKRDASMDNQIESIYFLGVDIANTDMNYNQAAHALGLSTVP